MMTPNSPGMAWTPILKVFPVTLIDGNRSPWMEVLMVVRINGVRQYRLPTTEEKAEYDTLMGW